MFMHESPKKNIDYQHELSRILAQQTRLIQRYELPDGTIVWVRRAGRHNAGWRYRLQNILARLVVNRLLAAVPNPGGQRTIATEAARLRALSAAGIAVPQLLAQQPDGLMMSQLGMHNLLKEWKNQHNHPDILLSRWHLGLRAIAEVHQQQQYLSQTFARNMMFIDDEHIGFIDFEDDPGTVLPLSLCQARDWLCYLHSGAIVMHQSGLSAEAQATWHTVLASEPPAIQAAVNKTLRSIGLMRHLQAQFWGNDTLRLAAMARFVSVMP